MGFTSNVSSGGRMRDMVATITNIGLDFQKYDNGKEEHRIIVVWAPEELEDRIQTDWLSSSSTLDIAGNEQTIQVGSSENAFELHIVGDIIKGGELRYKAAIWMDRLEELEVSIPSTTGNLEELIGLQARIHQMTFNEALGKKAGEKEKPFWMPTKIISMPTKKVSLQEAVMEVIEGKTEAEMEMWYKAREGFDGSVTLLYKMLTKLEETSVRVINNKYQLKGDVSEK